MDSKEILDSIDEFFRTADEEALAEARAAFTVEIEDDISLEEYLSGISDGYFYTHDCESNCYASDALYIIQTNSPKYTDMGFEEAVSDYGKTDLNITLNMESSHKGEVTKMIKKAA